MKEERLTKKQAKELLKYLKEVLNCKTNSDVARVLDCSSNIINNWVNRDYTMPVFTEKMLRVLIIVLRNNSKSLKLLNQDLEHLRSPRFFKKIGITKQKKKD